MINGIRMPSGDQLKKEEYTPVASPAILISIVIAERQTTSLGFEKGKPLLGRNMM
jgi:hypothetical protein